MSEGAGLKMTGFVKVLGAAISSSFRYLIKKPSKGMEAVVSWEQVKWMWYCSSRPYFCWLLDHSAITGGRGEYRCWCALCGKRLTLHNE